MFVHGGFMKKQIVTGLCLMLSVTFLSAAPKARKPKNFAEIFGKTWVLDKAILNKKDMTAQFTKDRMQGALLTYTFAEDGGMTSNEPDVISADWKFDDAGFKIHNKLKVPEDVPAGQGYAQDTTIIYTIKIAKGALTIEQAQMKMTLTFKAQKP